MPFLRRKKKESQIDNTQQPHANVRNSIIILPLKLRKTRKTQRRQREKTSKLTNKSMCNMYISTQVNNICKQTKAAQIANESERRSSRNQKCRLGDMK